MDAYNYVIPNVIEKTNGVERAYDLYSKMLKDNIIFVGTPIDDGVANVVCAQLLHLESENPDKDINLYINSPGGSTYALMAIYDTMQFIKPKVATYCMGLAASAAAVLLAAGAEGKRFALPHSRIMIHQPHVSGVGGQASDIEIHAREILKTREDINKILADHTGQDVETVRHDTERDKFLSALEAKEYGIVDQVIMPRKDIGVAPAA